MSLTLFEIVVAFMLACAAYRGAKRSGLWDWTMFFQVVGANLAFGLMFVGGLVYTGLP